MNVNTTPIITLNASAVLPELRPIAIRNTIVENTPERKLT